MNENTRFLVLGSLRRSGAKELANGNWSAVGEYARAYQVVATGTDQLGYVDFRRVTVTPAPRGEMTNVMLHLGTNLTWDGASIRCPDWAADPGLIDHFRRRIFVHDGSEAMIAAPARIAAAGLDLIDLTHVWTRNWFHFLIEVVSLFADPEVQDSTARIAINRAALDGTYGEALALLAPGMARRLLPTADWGRIDCASLLQPRGIWQPSYYHDDPAIPAHRACRFLDPDAARALYKRAWPARPPKGNRLVIRRPDSSVARCLNQDALIDHFTALGHDAISPEALDFADQAAAFYDADVIVGVSGAAFANLVFCRPGTRVICARSASADNVVYARIAEAMGLDFHYVDNELAEYSAAPDLGVFTVDPDAMARIARGS